MRTLTEVNLKWEKLVQAIDYNESDTIFAISHSSEIVDDARIYRYKICKAVPTKDTVIIEINSASLDYIYNILVNELAFNYPCYGEDTPKSKEIQRVIKKLGELEEILNYYKQEDMSYTVNSNGYYDLSINSKDLFPASYSGFIESINRQYIKEFKHLCIDDYRIGKYLNIFCNCVAELYDNKYVPKITINNRNCTFELSVLGVKSKKYVLSVEQAIYLLDNILTYIDLVCVYKLVSLGDLKLASEACSDSLKSKSDENLDAISRENAKKITEMCNRIFKMKVKLEDKY